MLTLLAPENRFPAIEERYGQWQAELLLSAAEEIRIVHYASDTPLKVALSEVATPFVAVVTNPLMVAERSLLGELMALLASTPDADAALPSANLESPAPRRLDPPRLYLTLRQYEEVAREITSGREQPAETSWGVDDPVLFVARTEKLARLDVDVRQALRGRRVVIARDRYIHVFTSQRGQPRLDLLERIPTEATRVLEFGCGEGALGAALKARQHCRIVGVELDEEAAAIARGRLDAVFSGDVRQWIGSVDERFEMIVGGDILEHLDEPWTFLRDLRRVAEPGARLLLSIPNIANYSIVGDLLRGRFDYVYLGILCAGHLRFFTRQTLEDMLTISGWKIRSIEPHESLITPEFEELATRLHDAGLPVSREQLATPGWYVHAEK